MELENKKEFYARKHVILSIVLIGVLILVYIALVMNMRHVMSAPIGIFILVFIVNIIRYNTVYLTIGDDYLSCKLSPILSAKSVLFQEVTYVQVYKNKWVIYYKQADESKERKLALPLNIMEDEERTAAVALLNSIFRDKIRMDSI